MANNLKFRIDDLELSQFESLLSKDSELLKLFKDSNVKDIYNHIHISYPYAYTIVITPIITKIFYNSGVDPLNYLKILPLNFLYNVKSRFDMTIPDNITHILEGAFEHCGVTSVVMPKSITHIDYSSFNDCYNLTEIKYEGTKDEFENISKDSGWFLDGRTKVYCSDGYLWVED